MRRHDLQPFFETSPAARLLRSDLGPWVIAFLHETFKSQTLISMGQSELRTRLAEFQSQLHETHPEAMTGSVERYLTHWTESMWLKRFVESHSSEPQFQLSSAAEEAIRFVEESIARRQNMVGTESRLRLIIDTLHDIVRGATDDPEKRLAFLRSQRDQLDREIAAIEAGKSVQVYRPPQIRERFQTAITLLRELQSDFRAVEDRFQEIARSVQRLQSSGNENRGSILGFALDAEETLKAEDEGVSFFAFVRFLLSPTEQMAVRKHIEEIQRLAALADQQDSLQRLRRMVPSLLAEADKVMRTTARLSATLRRLLDSRAAAHRARLAQVLADIRKLAMQLRESTPVGCGISIVAEAEIQSPLTRPFWIPEPSFESCDMAMHTADHSHAKRMAAVFARMPRLDFQKLRQQVRDATLEGNECTLQELLQSHPSELGMVELLGYLQIAHDDGHEIDLAQYDVVEWSSPRSSPHTDLGEPETSTPPTPSIKMRARLPRVIFRAKSNSRPAGRKPR